MMIFDKIFEQRNLEKLYCNPKGFVYLICNWGTKYTILDCRWTGEMVEVKTRVKGTSLHVPEIVEWTDNNGVHSKYYKCPIFHASTGATEYWSFDRAEAERIAKELNATYYSAHYDVPKEEVYEEEKVYQEKEGYEDEESRSLKRRSRRR